MRKLRTEKQMIAYLKKVYSLTAQLIGLANCNIYFSHKEGKFHYISMILTRLDPKTKEEVMITEYDDEGKPETHAEIKSLYFGDFLSKAQNDAVLTELQNYITQLKNNERPEL